MAFPTTSVLDNFNRATLGTNWTNDPFHGGATAFPIQGSVAVGGTGYSEEWWNVATYGPDCECYVTISTNPTSGTSGQGFWVTARLAQQESSAASTGDGYQAFVSKLVGTDKVQIMRYDIRDQHGADAGHVDAGVRETARASGLRSSVRP
jgi:hypothetical protein